MFKSISLIAIALCMTGLSADVLQPQDIQKEIDLFQHTAEMLCQQPPENCTFENTLLPWERCTKRLQYFLDKLDDSETSENVFWDYEGYISQLKEQPEFQTISNLAEKIANDSEASHFQKFIAESIRDETIKPILHLTTLSDYSEELNPNAVLRYATLGLVDADQLTSFIDDILFQDSDAVFIQGVYNHSDAYEILDRVRDRYFYFAYTAHEIITTSDYEGGIMAISKDPIRVTVTYPDEEGYIEPAKFCRKSPRNDDKLLYRLSTTNQKSCSRASVSAGASWEYEFGSDNVTWGGGVQIKDGHGNHIKGSFVKSTDQKPKLVVETGHDPKDKSK